MKLLIFLSNMWVKLQEVQLYSYLIDSFMSKMKQIEIFWKILESDIHIQERKVEEEKMEVNLRMFI